jgi:predicted MFS family arabinose efflux permease
MAVGIPGGAGRRWVILFVVFLSTLAFAMVLQSVPPVLSLILDEFHLSHAQGGLLMSFFALPGIFVAIPAGILADRYSQKLISMLSHALMIAGTLLFAAGGSLAVLAAGRIVAGVGSMTLLVVLPQLLAQWFDGRELGIAMGVFNTAVPLGTILSLNFLSLLAETWGWRAGIWVSAGLSLSALVIFALFFAPAPQKGEGTASPVSLLHALRTSGVPVWLVGAAWLLFNAAIISLFTFTPDLLRSSGFTVASAGFFTGLVMMPALVLSPAVGYLMDKIDGKRAIITIGAVALAALIIWVPAATGRILLLMGLIGVAQALVPAPIFALAPEVTVPERLGLGYGILSTCLNIGIVVGPVLVGMVRDITGNYQASYTLMSVFALLMTAAMFLLGRRMGKSGKDRM